MNGTEEEIKIKTHTHMCAKCLVKAFDCDCPDEMSTTEDAILKGWRYLCSECDREADREELPLSDEIIKKMFEKHGIKSVYVGHVRYSPDGTIDHECAVHVEYRDGRTICITDGVRYDWTKKCREDAAREDAD